MSAPGSEDRGRPSLVHPPGRGSDAPRPEAGGEAPPAAAELARRAVAACLAGDVAASDALWARAHRAFLESGEVESAARCAFWMAFELFHRGQHARAGGWIGRAQRLLDRTGRECVEQGYLLLPAAMRSVMAGDAAAGLAACGRAAALGERFRDPDLVALALNGRGRALIRLGEIEAGMALLDEAMAAVEAGEVSPLVTGDVYCSVIEACQEIFDLRRAHEWTAALASWCDSQPERVPYRGPCLVRRAEILQLQGAWGEAAAEAERACDHLTQGGGRPAAGGALYRRAELHRLHGEFAAAEDAYRRASEWGHAVQPGLALFRLEQGEVETAAAAIRSALESARDRAARTRLLPAFVEVMLAAGETDAARDAADELAAAAAELDAPLVRALADRARGAVALAMGDAPAALDRLRAARAGWQEVGAAYEDARTRLLMGLACRRLGDLETAELELAAARRVFEALGAVPDLARARALEAPPDAGSVHGLTARELEVLRHLAAGRSNKAIAAELRISRRTVERHVSNLFGKIGVSSRAAATRYAYQNRLA